MKIRNESINKNYLIPSVITTLGIATVFGVGIYNAANIANTSNASALSYSTSKDISFTFAPTLSIGLSTDSLTIDNLVPGTTSDSNKVSVTVSSNTPYGYVLSAGVGSTVSTDPYYNTSDLVHDNTATEVPTTNKFSSISTTASLESLNTDNTWGYSTSTDGGTSWSTYSGLSHAETKPLLDISDPAQPSTIDFKIAARSASTQASGTYNNVITFYAVGKPEPQYLYEEIAKMSKGTQTLAQLQAAITAPTTTDYTADTSNSGVYEYNSSVFGEASDASNANKIYYYRGVLEPRADQGTYGSDGKATTYPNYVRLGNNTCWRIVRTTGSGGVKMIYNGTWQGTAESGTCANVQANAKVATSAFNSTYDSIVYVGYTYNSNYTTNSNTNGVSPDVVFGNSDPTVNNTRSTIKTYIEDTWYPSKLSSYTSMLEPNAGYCNDRSYYGTATGTTKEQIQSTISTSGTVYFGARNRNFVNNSTGPSLNCTRGDIDIYRYVANSTGLANELKVPAALLTADEAALAGSGDSSGNPTTYNVNSYLHSGSLFWLLSPILRAYGAAHGSLLHSDGYLAISSPIVQYGVRPSISLKPGTTVASGTGIATDPWVVPAP